MLHNFAGASCKTLLFQYTSFFKTRLHLVRPKQCRKANRLEYNERAANLQNCQQPCYPFSGVPSIFWVVSMEMNEK